MIQRITASLLALALMPLAATAQGDASSPAPDSERWNIFFQATSIGQYHGSFASPYSSPFSLQGHPEAEVSLTSTLFFGLRFTPNTMFYFNPEVAGGRGFSGTDGIANFPNGEMPRVAKATPTPYLARLLVTHDFGFGAGRVASESDENQLGGSRPATRYSITLGRFSSADFFDNNRYSHDPRTQFMGWAVMYNGAWDYAADTRGYTWGWVHEFHTRNWSVRYASAAMPRVANGERFDRQLFRDRSDMFEGEFDAKIHGHQGAVRVLSYVNHFDGGTYANAIHRAQLTRAQPDITVGRSPGTLKYGFGISADQEIAKDLGVFGRLGWNDGKTQSFAFTAMDRLATLGVSLNGSRWHRSEDTLATALTIGGLSAIHAQYLAMGGHDFLIGDGALRYGPESSWETYYTARVMKYLFATVGLDHVDNPAYNRDRGPVWAGTFRLHLEAGKK